jgi:hypothetical protein
MDINKMIADLRYHREQIEEAILSLERLARGQGKRRGRPPGWLKAVQEAEALVGKKNHPGKKRPRKKNGGVFAMPETVAS